MFKNGNLKSLQSIWLHLALTKRFRNFVSNIDREVFIARSNGEGIPFLTKTLPTIGKSLDSFHATYVWTEIPDFCKSTNGFPLFLGKALERAIEGNADAVDCVRQLTYLFYKLETPYDESVIKDFLDSFILNDLELPDLTHLEDSRLIGDARRLIARVLCNSNPLNIRPNHGSGATACRTKPQDKWYKLDYFPNLDRFYPYDSHFFFSPTHLADELDRLENMKLGDPMARVCLVPKDSRGPRIISCEPLELMYVQQGLMRLMYSTIERNKLTRGYVNFTDQAINRSLAQIGSVSDSFATIDLKDASDRVSLQLTEMLFPRLWFDCLRASRSTHTKLPDGRVVKLNKFAPMGSACCFPVEALVFWAIATASIGTNGNVWVYGDDIICDADKAVVVMDALSSVGLVVNKSKSYVSGPFRESCGGDFYLGRDVTPVKLRRTPDLSCTGRIATMDFLNNLIEKFNEPFHDLCLLLQLEMGPFVRTLLPIPGTLRLPTCSSNDVFFQRRWNKNLQRYEHRIPQPTIRTKEWRKPAWSEFLKKELSREEGPEPSDFVSEPWREPSSSELKPGVYSDPHSERMKWAWTWLG